MQQFNAFIPANLLRRLGAAIYDTLIVIAILMVSTALCLILTGGQAIRPENLLYQCFLLIVITLFYVFFWCCGGQTLGMRAWRIRLMTTSGQGLSGAQAVMRFLYALLTLAPLGTGFLVALFNQHNRTLYDIWTRTLIVSVASSNKPNKQK